MSERTVTILLVVAVLLGVSAGTALVVRQPAFWLDLGSEAVRRAWPEVVRIWTGRMTPEQELAWRQCERRGVGKWNHAKKRCE